MKLFDDVREDKPLSVKLSTEQMSGCEHLRFASVCFWPLQACRIRQESARSGHAISPSTRHPMPWLTRKADLFPTRPGSYAQPLQKLYFTDSIMFRGSPYTLLGTVTEELSEL